MAIGYTGEEVVYRGAAVSVTASQTKSPITDKFRLHEQDSLYFMVDVTASAVTGTVDLILQDSWDGLTWFDRKATTIATPSTVTIKLLATDSSDFTYLPMRSLARVVATTGGGEALTVTSVIRSARK